MTIFERIEKKIFFRLLSFMIFIIAFLSFIAIATGVITISIPNFAKQSSEISVQKDEIEAAMKPEVKPQVSNVQSDQNSTVVVSEDEPDIKLATSIAKRILASKDFNSKDAGYNAELGRMTDSISGTFNKYDEDTKMSGLRQLDEMSNAFTKNKFADQVNTFISLFDGKYNNEQRLKQEKEIAVAANKAIALQAIGAGVVAFAIFVMILVLLRIEKNTRQLTQENNAYDKKDKIILFSLMGAALAISLLIGLLSGATSVGKSDFNATAQAREQYLSGNMAERNTTQASVVNVSSDANMTEAVESNAEIEANVTYSADQQLIYFASRLLGVSESEVVVTTDNQGNAIYCVSDMSICKTADEVSGSIEQGE